MTDRASAEGLRARIESLIDDDEAAYVSVALIRAALRSSESDSGIDVQRLALIHRPVTNPMYPRPICEDDGQEWPCKTAIVARLSTPRKKSETNEDRWARYDTERYPGESLSTRPTEPPADD